MTYMKDKRKRDGVEIDSKPIPLKEFEEMIDNCRELAEEVSKLSDIIRRHQSPQTINREIEQLYDLKP